MRKGRSISASKTIAALLGPTLIAAALMVLLNLEAMPTMIEELSKFPMMIVIAGFAAFTPGLAIVYFRNRWTGGWPVLITVFGWLSVSIGLARIVCPMRLVRVMAKAGPAMHVVLPVADAIFLLVGGFLSFKAYGRD